MIKKAYDHDVENNHRNTFCPVGFRVCGYVVDEEARTEQDGHFKYIYDDIS